jgi:WD40 repeat protein
LQTFHHASSIDFLDNKILVGHDNGRICTFDVTGENYKLHSVTHHDGECWGLEILPETNTFLTCGDDNEFHEYSLRTKSWLRAGKIWTRDINEGQAYATKKIKSTASTLCDYPAHQQGRAICYNKLMNHVAVSNNYGDIMVYDYNDFSNILAVLMNPREWVETMKYSPNCEMLAVGAHDDTVYVYSIDDEG